MKTSILAVALLSASTLVAQAQTTPAPTTNGNTPAVATPGTKNPTAPVAGANSFTESQAKSRIEGAGYTGVKDLKLDDKGVWQAMAMKDGKSAAVSLDYQGNVVSK
jgi:predicted transcriptional regulator